MSADLPPLTEAKPGAPVHKLQNTWAVWVQKKHKRPGTNWFEGTQCVGRFNTVEGFWQVHGYVCGRLASVRRPTPPPPQRDDGRE
jgi:hypothetical protein